MLWGDSISTDKGLNKNNDLNLEISMKALGNYTKHAVENFEENIVSQTNYLEKVDNALKNHINARNTDE